MNRENSAPYLWLVGWKALKSLEVYDRASIEASGFGCLSDFAVLEVLLHKGSLPVNTIGRQVLLTSGSITTAVSRCEKAGWVERKPDPEDGRVTRVDLTLKGRRVIEEAFERHSANLERVYSVLDKQERAELGRLLKKVGKAAEALNL